MTGTDTPAGARAAYRSGLIAPTSGHASGCTQANLVILPRDWAWDMLLFGQRNPQPVPLLDVTEPGSPRTELAREADLRTDLPLYRVWRDGELVEEVPDVTDLWRDDLVSFLIGCSFSFERALLDAGVPVRNIEQGRNVAMFRTNRDCRPAGRLSGELVVSMRPVPAALVATAVQVTGRMPQVHGAPVHIGGPASLGIAGLAKPDFGEPIEFEDGDVPVFWACGVTPQAALMASRPPFAITHAPGHMFVTDVPDAVYRQP
ncbi:putative hydro-lyase [Ornithinimicrobium faecis]|uniref:Putative hydro-lyase NF556_01685 n=1 Tax=Ornithinimicrobium faecis TaxID=2934158 RepID=A0ABY4YVJ9_9MICO|nr:putative hydro-lyase [Ornithinimicrobium sp. HY1793]USQ80403.1 putative hydro-lyase [Ornithinimicrobium sp. HY1793]